MFLTLLPSKKRPQTNEIKGTFPIYQFAQFYLFIFLMPRLLITKYLRLDRSRFVGSILSAHFIALLYCFIYQPKTTGEGKTSSRRDQEQKSFWERHIGAVGE